MAAPGWEDDDWEAINDDGFVYKRKKRHRQDPPSTSSAADTAAAAVEDNHLRKRRRNALLKVRERYQAEISQWELLSNTLKASMEKIENQQRVIDQPSTSDVVRDGEVGFVVEREGLADSVHRRRIDELEIRVQAEDAVIQGISNLCDTAEAICDAQEKRLKKKYLNLPIWASPREIMAVLCDTQRDENEGNPISS